ncbi:MAG: hypothetical protein ACLR23_00005 [Clostridia bacterium]
MARLRELADQQVQVDEDEDGEKGSRGSSRRSSSRRISIPMRRSYPAPIHI